MNQQDFLHKSIFLEESCLALLPEDDGVYLDGTLGGGGHTEKLLSMQNCRVFGVDRDPVAIQHSQKRLASFGNRFNALHGRFSECDKLLNEANINNGTLDGALLDLGVSSPQLDHGARGFSFNKDAPLDMRMNQHGLDPSAADLINSLSETQLVWLFTCFGEEKESKRTANAIIRYRSENGVIKNTLELQAIIRKAKKHHQPKQDPATKIFQALRIAVNQEFLEIILGLEAIEKLLRPGGRMAIITFHSIEDKIVKFFLQERCKKIKHNKYKPTDEIQKDNMPSFRWVKKIMEPSKDEIQDNRRARSARLRVVERTNDTSKQRSMAFEQLVQKLSDKKYWDLECYGPLF